MNSILIKGADVLLPDFRQAHADILVEDGSISKIGRINSKAEVTINARAEGLAAIPGFINTHAHIAMAALRGRVDGLGLWDFIRETSAFDARNSADMIYNSAVLGIAEMIRNGITDFVDFYYGEDSVARAVSDMGYQGNLAWVVLDRDKTTQNGDPVSNAENFIRRNRHPNVNPMIAIQGVYAASKDTIGSAYELAEKYDKKVTMHIAETQFEVREHRKKYGFGPVEWLHKYGFINKRLLAVHCVWLSRKEVAIVSESGAISYNPTSNMKLGSGIAPVYEMNKRGARITLGTDSVASNNSLDIFSEMKYGALLQGVRLRNPGAISAKDAFSFATSNASGFLYGRAYGIARGAPANIVLLRRSANSLRSSILSDAVYSANPSDVAATIVRGNLLYRNGFGEDLAKKVKRASKYVYGHLPEKRP
ncbi:MAG: amidohydrolase family protein [Candidatus Marsarchaeota archaeon]|nr:amidohydrolase family protein [Candidatus Marsarchaeota archaeon]